MVLTSTLRSRASVCRLSATCRTMAPTSTCLSGRRCALSSMRESESRSSISRAMRSACACMIGRKRSRAAGSSRAEPRSVSMKPDSAASGVRSSWLALATKSARISSTRRSGVRSWNASSTRPGLAATPGDEIGVTITSYQRSSGTRSENSTRCAVPLARARRIASSTSGTRSPSETGSPGRSAGATAVARALSATTSPRRSSATTGSGSPASTASIKGSPTRARARLVPGQRRRRDVAARACDQRRQRHQHETRERRQRGGGAEQPQAGERDRRGDQHQAHAPEALDPAADPDAIVNHCHVSSDS